METNRVVAAYAAMIEERVSAGWRAYIATFTFNQLPGSEMAKRHQQELLVARAYRHLSTRVTQRPQAIARRGRLPVWIGAPDLPVPKHSRLAPPAPAPNGGWHYHVIAAQPPWGRKGEIILDTYFEEHQAALVQVGGLRHVEAEPVTHDVAYVCGYVLKAVERGTVGLDEILLLPQVKSES